MKNDKAEALKTMIRWHTTASVLECWGRISDGPPDAEYKMVADVLSQEEISRCVIIGSEVARRMLRFRRLFCLRSWSSQASANRVWFLYRDWHINKAVQRRFTT